MLVFEGKNYVLWVRYLYLCLLYRMITTCICDLCADAQVQVTQMIIAEKNH